MPPPSPPLFLIGPRCSGKTTLAGLLAERFDWLRLDTDELLTAEAGMSVAAIVAAEGWEGFRRREARALAIAAERRDAVVATGGGIVLRPENRALMRERGVVIYLEAPAELLGHRLAGDGGAAARPSLTGRDPGAEMALVLEERAPLYRETAHHRVDATLEPEAVAGAVAAFLDQTGRTGHRRS